MSRLPSATSALYVRLPTAKADKLDRAARRLGVPKNVLVSRLVSGLDDTGSSGSPDGEGPAVPVSSAPAGDRPPVGFYSFRTHELPEVLTPGQAGELLQLAESAVIELAEAGQLPARRLGREWRFSRAGLVTWLSHGLRTEPPVEEA